MQEIDFVMHHHHDYKRATKKSEGEERERDGDRKRERNLNSFALTRGGKGNNGGKQGKKITHSINYGLSVTE